MKSPRRTYIGRYTGLVTRQRVFRIADGLEMDDIDHYEITRRRVFFDDVLAVTYHQETGWWFVGLLGMGALLFIALAVFTRDEIVALAIFLVLALCFLIPAVLRLFTKVDIINVFGRRTRVKMRFTWRKRHAQKIFSDITAAVQRAQRAAAQQVPREAPAAVPAGEVPPLPPE